MKSKDRIILQKIISYIKEVESYIEGLITARIINFCFIFFIQ